MVSLLIENNNSIRYNGEEPIDFNFESFIVLDVPLPIKEQVMKIRKAHRDVFRISLPVEITVTGSSGVGSFEIDQSPEEVFTILNKIAEQTSPIHASFDEVHRFPDTDIFVLTLEDETPFIALHNHIINSGIRFQPNPFPYKPHCTLRSRSPISEEEEIDILAVNITTPFILETISVYLMNRIPITLLHRVRLTGKPN